MKIAYIYANLPQYRKDFFKKLSSALIDDGIKLSVLHGTNIGKKIVIQDDNSSYEKQQYVSIKKSILRTDFIIIKNLFKSFARDKYHAMVISYVSTNITMLRIVIFCIINKIPYATWRCGYNRPDYSKISSRIRQMLINFVEKNANYNITYGSFYKQELIHKGIKPEKIMIAQNTINVEDKISNYPELKKEYSLTTNILFVGALIKSKYLQSSIDAICKLNTNGFLVKFDIIGGGELLEELRKYVNEQNLENVVYLHGPKYNDDLIGFFKRADVFLLAGTGGLAINEAMAYGLPIISTNADGTGIDLIDGNGYYMDEFGNADLQYEFLEKFIKLSEDEKIYMSKKSREIVLQKASLSNMVEKHRDICKSLLNIQEREKE